MGSQAWPLGADELEAAVAALGPVKAVGAIAGRDHAIGAAARCLIAHPEAQGILAPRAGARGVRVLLVERNGSRREANQAVLLKCLRQSD